MKKFNFVKGLVISLMAFALAIATFGAVKASAAEGTKTITFKAKVGDELKGTYSIEYTPGKAAVEDDEETEDVDESAAAVAPVFKASDATLAKVLEELGKADDTVYIRTNVATSATPNKVSFNDGGALVLDAVVDEDITVTIPVEVPTVTFNITVADMLKTGNASESGTYRFVTGDTFLKNKDVVTFADIIAEMKKLNGNAFADPEVKLAEASAWVVQAFADNQTDLTTYITKASDKLTLKKQLDKNLTFDFTVANSKIPVKFTYTADNKDYTAVIEVDNKKADNKILFTDIVDKLKTTVVENEANVEKTFAEINGESIILADGFAAAEETVTGKYATWVYKYSTDGALTTAPTPKAITATKIVPAFEEADYDPAIDAIKFVSKVDLTLYWVDCKKSAGVQVKGDKVNALSLTKNAKNDNKYEGTISLSDKEAGVKVAENKTAYINVSLKAPAEEKTKYTANYIVDATPYKKIVVTFAYAQAEKDSPDIAINTITTTDTNKKTVVYSGLYDADTNTDHYLYKIENEKPVASDILKGLQYSADGTTWYDVISEDETVNGKTVNNSFTCGKLYGYVNGDSKTTLFFRVKGSEALPEIAAQEGDDNPNTPWIENEGRPAKNAYRATKPVKAAIAAAKAGKAVKIDVSKGTIALKNGYDFAITSGEKVEPTLKAQNGTASMFTILPFNKAGKATKTEDDVSVAIDVCETVLYAPVAKVTENAEMFTNIKVKNYSLEKIAETCGASIAGTGNIYLWVRKSATAKKPADKWTLMVIPQVAAAPTAKADKTGLFAKQDPADAKGTVAGIEVSNAKSDKTSGAYEFLIVDAADIITSGGVLRANIDFTTAKWTTLTDKGLTVAKSKSKYSKEEGKKATDHVLKDGSAVLIRRAGDKSANVLASDYIVTMVAKQDVTYKDADNKDQTKALYVWKAFAQAAE